MAVRKPSPECPAINFETGVKFLAREAHFDLKDNQLRLVRCSWEEFKADGYPDWYTGYRVDRPDAPKKEVYRPDGSLVMNEDPAPNPDIIQTKSGRPFKTEQSARNQMAKQKLDMGEYMVMPVDDGYIITRI